MYSAQNVNKVLLPRASYRYLFHPIIMYLFQAIA